MTWLIVVLAAVVAVEVALVVWIAWDIRQFKRKWRKDL